MAIFTTPDRSHMTPESDPKMRTIAAALLPTRIAVMFTDDVGDGPGVRAAQNSRAKRNKTATEPKRAMTPRRGWRKYVSAAMATITTPSTTTVQRVTTVREPTRQGAFTKLIGLNVSDE